MRIVVMGSGGTGGYFGAKLARAGGDVTFVARGAPLAPLGARGLRVKSAIDGEWVVRAPAVERLDGLPPADLVLFCVKSFDTERAGEVIKPVVGPDTGVLPVQNGVDNEEKLERILGPGHVMGGGAQVLSTIETPGVVSHRFLGRVVFGGVGRGGKIPGNVFGARGEKYVFIAAPAGMTALTRCPAGVVRAVPETRAMYRLILGEMVALGNAVGAGLDADLPDTAMGMLDNLGAAFTSSLHHDLAEGKRLELEALHGHAVRLGERHGIPTPMLFAVYAALKPYADGPPQAATA